MAECGLPCVEGGQVSRRLSLMRITSSRGRAAIFKVPFPRHVPAWAVDTPLASHVALAPPSQSFVSFGLSAAIRDGLKNAFAMPLREAKTMRLARIMLW